MSQFSPINDSVKAEDLGDVLEAPKTPKRKIAAQGGTPKKAKNDTPKSSVKPIKASKIPETFDELADEDKMMIEWKERGEGWGVINEEWKRITGNMPGKSTLPNRYTRVKASLACVASDDVEQMLTSEVEINKQIEAEVKDLWNKKWARIGKQMEDAGKQSYPAATLEKHYKKMKATGGVATAATRTPTPAEGADDEMEG
ncbi:hypothetical protein EG328_001873 [Venturia inaequalis]|uniref:Uncharacterized protein n=1 Tax=Venturia inaequalis TaxID=5025 RepID=A0A8H3UYN8_VENIN|nr:hypothetical protein EG328_001873 [Venturia inaequalis]KAE9981783.1 hypothetical protein EG327_006099 [Venturia inaequalis]